VDGVIRARYRETLERAELMQPGKIHKMTIAVPPTSNVFKKGHRIRLDISSSNLPKFDVNPNKRGQIQFHTRTRIAHTESTTTSSILRSSSSLWCCRRAFRPPREWDGRRQAGTDVVDRSLEFLILNKRDPTLRRRAVTEIRGLCYSPVGKRYLQDLVETMGATLTHSSSLAARSP
jgi:hypothetical protein